MTTIITGKPPKVEKKGLTQSISFGNPGIQDFRLRIEERYNIPAEAVVTSERNEGFMFIQYTWTWYEVTV